MANVVGNGVSRIIMDADGEQVTVTSNRLHTDALSEVQGHAAIISAGINVTGDTVKASAGLPLVDFYSLAFIMYVGSAADPGTEGYNQGGGEGGDGLGREGP